MQTTVQLTKQRKTLSSGTIARYWSLRWRGTSGQWVYESIGRANGPSKLTKNAAESLRHRKQESLNSNLAPIDPLRPVTLSEWITQDSEHQQLLKRPSTVRDNKLACLAAMRALGGGKCAEAQERGGSRPLSQITRREATQVRAWMLEDGMSKASVAKHLRHLRAVFNRARAEGLITQNPFERIELPKPTSIRKRIFSLEEVDAMVAAAPDAWWRAFIELGCTTGLRSSEMLHLTWEGVDFEQQTITVEGRRGRSVDLRDGSRTVLLDWSPKSGKARTVPLADRAAIALSDVRTQSDGSPYVFLTLARLKKLAETPVDPHRTELGTIGTGPIPARIKLVNNMNSRFTEIQSRARELVAAAHGLDVAEVNWERGTIHDMRRTFGTHTSRSVPMHALKEFMGHAKIQTTQEFYLAVAPEDADAARAVWRPAGGNLRRDAGSGVSTRGSTEQLRDAIRRSQNDETPALAGASGSEADGTRTRNHRIDSRNQGVLASGPEVCKPVSDKPLDESTGTSREPVGSGFGAGQDALLDAPAQEQDAPGKPIIAGPKLVLYCLCRACNAKGFSRSIPNGCPRCGATGALEISLWQMQITHKTEP